MRLIIEFSTRISNSKDFQAVAIYWGFVPMLHNNKRYMVKL